MDFNIVGPILALIVTCLGFILSVVSIFFIAFGTKVPAQADQPHKLKFKDIEVQTDRIVMLLTVCILASVLPLGGYYWLVYKGFDNVSLHLIATVEEAPGILATDTEVLLVRMQGEKEERQCPDKKLINGVFSCRPRLRSLSDVFELRIHRIGLLGRIIPVSPTQQAILVTLKGER
jgi:hypothetical protein